MSSLGGIYSPMFMDADNVHMVLKDSVHEICQDGFT